MSSEDDPQRIVRTLVLCFGDARLDIARHYGSKSSVGDSDPVIYCSPSSAEHEHTKSCVESDIVGAQRIPESIYAESHGGSAFA